MLRTKNTEAMSFKRSPKTEPERNRYHLNARGVYCLNATALYSVHADAWKGDSIAFEERTASAMIERRRACQVQ